ncbi:MAG: polyribonucleotide nucleotidyltransferase, partial [Alphaproteobacteria bacterium]|nr:polyribonucleotide nucleotidyltransferase [Alphaproteobacteria bacterium]
SFKNETQIICNLLSHDLENDPDILGVIGASAALAVSGLPFMGPVGASRVAIVDGEMVLNPTLEQMKESRLDLIVAGTNEGVLMVESEAHELSEDIILDAVMFGHDHYQPVIKMIEKLAKKVGKESWALTSNDDNAEKLFDSLKSEYEADLRKAYKNTEKLVRIKAIEVIKKEALQKFVSDDVSATKVLIEFKHLEKDVVRGDTLKKKKRIDGRSPEDIRPITVEVGIVPRVHGSALFTRGETQALVITTLGTGQDEQVIDAIDGEYRENFMLHYNFPPYSVGETGRFGAPGRREIGHGKLAWRAIHPLLPARETFPYTIQVMTEITESNGSSSMATVCGSSLSLMDAGVPLKKPVAGIAMGLIKEKKDFVVLSDILGDEDFLGDMDFKVAGTDEGITSLQMDIKITSITKEIMQTALIQARAGRLHILDKMSDAIDTSRQSISANAPRIESIQIPKEKIRDVIGTGGKVIREICEVTGARIEIKDDGTVEISAMDLQSIEAAIARIRSITTEPEVGTIYRGKVTKIMEFGALVAYLGDRAGLVHISQLAPQRVETVTDIVQSGAEVYVKLIGFDDRGKAKLSMKVVNQETGEDLSDKA